MLETIGLTQAEVNKRLKQYGPNELKADHASFVHQLIAQLTSPINLMLALAAGLSYFVGHHFDFYFILSLVIANSAISLWQEFKADSSISKLNQRISSTVDVCRDGSWSTVDIRGLVPGDWVRIRVGSVIPADANVLSATNLTLDESSLTGESLPHEHITGDQLYAGAFVSTGTAELLLTETGRNTYLGRTLASARVNRARSSLEVDILSITRFLSIIAIAAVGILVIDFLLIHRVSIAELLILSLSLIIAGVPISLPTVMNLVIKFGVIELAKKQVVVRRISSLEDLANVDLVLSDKTGTLTRNNLKLIETYPDRGVEKILREAGQMAVLEPNNPINKAIIAAVSAKGLKIDPRPSQDYIPADSSRKRVTLVYEENGRSRLVSVGAPQVIFGLSKLSVIQRKEFDNVTQTWAKRGYRTLAVAVGAKSEANLTLLGLLAISDEVRTESAETIAFLTKNGVAVKMVTGDNAAIADEVSKQLHLVGGLVDRRGLSKLSAKDFEQTATFAEVLPEDKLWLVRLGQKNHVVAVTGDGVNDLPAVVAAQVGIAVKNSVDALRSTADIVLLSDGIGVISEAVIEGRRIFARLYAYSIYRLSESFRLIITIALLGIVYGQYPITSLQIILLALLNDLPIISLAFDRVEISDKPAKVNARERIGLSMLFGSVGVINSFTLFILMTRFWGVPLAFVQTAFFLKLTVSGHLLIYTARTKRLWFRYLPSKIVIIATLLTQIVATILAGTGFLMPSALPWSFILFIWVWSAGWMQVSEGVKHLYFYLKARDKTVQ